MTNQTDFNTPVDDIEARLMAIAFNAVKEAALAKSRDTQFTDNDTKTALTVRKILENIAGLVDDHYQPMPLAVKNEGNVSPLIDKVYNMLDKDLSDEVVNRISLKPPQTEAHTSNHEKRTSKQQIV